MSNQLCNFVKVFLCFIFVVIGILFQIVFLKSDPFGKQRINKTWSGGNRELKFRVNKDLYPWENNFIEVPFNNKGMVEIHYLDVGPRDAPVLLMTHGNPAWSFLYHRMIPILSKKFRCIAPDLPGYGLSREPRGDIGYKYAPEHAALIIKEFIVKMDLHDITGFMQDWAGPITAFSLIEIPERFRGLVIGNTFVSPLTLPGVIFSKVMGNQITTYFAQLFNMVCWFFLSEFHGDPMSPEEKEMFWLPWTSDEIWTRGKSSLMARHLTKSHEWLEMINDQLKEKSSKVKNIDVLFLWGDKDFAFTQDYLDYLQENIFTNTGNKVIHFENSGHFWQRDAGPESAEQIENWYQEKFGY